MPTKHGFFEPQEIPVGRKLRGWRTKKCLDAVVVFSGIDGEAKVTVVGLLGEGAEGAGVRMSIEVLSDVFQFVWPGGVGEAEVEVGADNLHRDPVGESAVNEVGDEVFTAASVEGGVDKARFEQGRVCIDSDEAIYVQGVDRLDGSREQVGGAPPDDVKTGFTCSGGDWVIDLPVGGKQSPGFRVHLSRAVDGMIQECVFTEG